MMDGVRVDQTTGRIVVDLSELLTWLRDTVHPSGIQRVQTCLAHRLLQHAKSEPIVFVAGQRGLVDAQLVPQAIIAALLDRLANGPLPRATLDDELERLMGARTPYSVGSGDVIVLLGAFWVFPETIGFLTHAKSKGGKFLFYVFDLIPMSHPQFFDACVQSPFLQAFVECAYFCDRVLAISAFTKSEVERFLCRLRIDAPVVDVPLAHEPLRLPGEGGHAGIRPLVRFVAARPFVLSVGTVEVRKNHLYLLEVWERWSEEGETEPPVLVIAGRRGWKVDAFFRKLEETVRLHSSVVVLDDLSDAEVAWLYERCLFTVFPSLVEGWGLPVGESLAYGKLAICSETGSLPEVGGDHAIYIDPRDVANGLATIRTYAEDEALRRAAETRIANEFTARTWDEVAKDLLDEARGLLAWGGSGRGGEIRLRKGPSYAVGLQDLNPADLATATNILTPLICTEGWSTPETWGLWSVAPDARLRFEVQGWNQGSVMVQVAVKTQPWAVPCALHLSASPVVKGASVWAEVHELVVLEIVVEPDSFGVVDLAIVVEGEMPRPPVDARWLHVALLAIAVIDTPRSGEHVNLLDTMAEA